MIHATGSIVINRATSEDAGILAGMVGELLHEIMRAIGEQAFHFELKATEERALDFLDNGKFVVFFAKDEHLNTESGFIALCESHALYSEGSFGTVTEFYVRPAYRSNGIGTMLMNKVKDFSKSRGWKRLEVTTPPLPQFDRSILFYEREGFKITGGRKLKVVL